MLAVLGSGMPRAVSAPSAASKIPVDVIVEGGRKTSQPDDMHICPLGIQIYTSKPMKEFTELAFDLSLPDARGRARDVKCTGTVVHCVPVKGTRQYRIWIHFTDLPANARDQIRCTSSHGNRRCGYCDRIDG